MFNHKCDGFAGLPHDSSRLACGVLVRGDVHDHILEMALGTQVNGPICHAATAPSLEPPPGTPVSETSIGEQVSPPGMCAESTHD